MTDLRDANGLIADLSRPRGNFSNHLDKSRWSETPKHPRDFPVRHVSRGHFGEVGVMEFGVMSVVALWYVEHAGRCMNE